MNENKGLEHQSIDEYKHRNSYQGQVVSVQAYLNSLTKEKLFGLITRCLYKKWEKRNQ